MSRAVDLKHREKQAHLWKADLSVREEDFASREGLLAIAESELLQRETASLEGSERLRCQMEEQHQSVDMADWAAHERATELAHCAQELEVLACGLQPRVQQLDRSEREIEQVAMEAATINHLVAEARSSAHDTINAEQLASVAKLKEAWEEATCQVLKAQQRVALADKVRSDAKARAATTEVRIAALGSMSLEFPEDLAQVRAAQAFAAAQLRELAFRLHRILTDDGREWFPPPDQSMARGPRAMIPALNSLVDHAEELCSVMDTAALQGA